MSADPVETVREFAAQTVAYVRRALGVELGYDSDTLPVLDHYLRTVPATQPSTTALVLTTAAAYFGQVVIAHIGGRWETSTAADITGWRVVLPVGLAFSPAAYVGAAVLGGEPGDLDTTLDAPPRMRRYVEEALARMGPVTEAEFYSLCGRLDTLEHIHEVLVAVAAELAGDPPPGDAAEAEDPDPSDDAAPDDAAPPLVN
ncbi:MAG: hypothetical protein R3B06_18910 [Kofleriaceae bacterium]